MRALVLLLVSACGRIDFNLTTTGADGGGPPDELGLSQDAVILGDGIAAPACGTTILLQDDFIDAGPAPTFNAYLDSGLTLREQNGRMEVVFGANVGDGRYAGYKSADTFTAEGLCAVAHVTQLPTSNGMAFFKLTSGVQQVEFASHLGNLNMRTHLNKQVATLLSIQHDLNAHAMLRLRHQGGMTYWDVSPNGSAYTALVATAFLTDPLVRYEVGAGAFGAASDAGVAAFAYSVAYGP